MANTKLHEAIFFIVVISLMMIFLINLIADLDNPFGYDDPTSAEDISLDVLISAVKRMQALQ
jgi:predicted membrane chloride channel (bestrophin family)